MNTIIEYTDRKKPENLYPARIISPSRPGPCCRSHMVEVGRRERDDQWAFRYKRCRQCGFTVRFVLERFPDPMLVADLRATFTKSFVRGL